MFHNISSNAKRAALSLLGFLALGVASAQTAITGVQCVLPGMTYQYELKASTKENEKLKICVENGVLVETSTACTEKESLSYVRVQWQQDKKGGKLTLSAPSGTTTLDVEISMPLNPGSIQTTDKQMISYNKQAPTLSCTPASGGNCSPVFVYQWEQSADKLRWTAISGATGMNLSLSTPLKQTMFFRRKAVESRSQSAGYSNEITVFVNHEPR
jgi:hypothetical protein